MAIDDIAAFLNETALFRNQWGFRPENGEDDASFKEGVRGLLRDQLATAKAGQLLVPQVAWGHFAANADGDDLVLFEDESRTRELMRYTFPRQTESPWLCISDFFRSVDSGEPDWASFQVVTMGDRVSEEAARLQADNQYQNYLYLHGLGVEMAEALAEYWHRRIREELGFADQDGPTLTGLFRQKYRGGRYSWGYPACPDLEDNAKVVELLGADRIGIEVSEGLPAPPGAVDHGDHLPPSASQVLRGVGRRRAVTAVAPAADRGRAQQPLRRRRWWRSPLSAAVDRRSPGRRGRAAVAPTDPAARVVGDLPATARLHRGPVRARPTVR